MFIGLGSITGRGVHKKNTVNNKTTNTAAKQQKREITNSEHYKTRDYILSNNYKGTPK